MVASISLPRTLIEIVGSEEIVSLVDEPSHRRIQSDSYLILNHSTTGVISQVVERMTWLNLEGLGPKVLGTEDGWLICERPAGFSADEPENHAEPGYLASRLAEAIRRLHEMPAKRCSFRRGWEDTAGEVASAIGENRIDPADLPDPYRRYSTAELHEIFIGGRAPVEDLVVAHGAPLLRDFYFDGDKLTGILAGATLGLADRNLDLAWLHRCVQETYGNEAVFSFYDSYGLGESLVAVDNYFLASFLLRADLGAGGSMGSGQSNRAKGAKMSETGLSDVFQPSEISLGEDG